MARRYIRSVLAAITVTAAFPIEQDFPSSSAIVDLGYARYQGVSLEAGVNQYLGIPYAAPPLGDLRWRAPQDPEPQTAVQDASKYGPICLGQLGLESLGISSGESEDCLTLNVFAPANMNSDSRLPVWVYFPGGGYALNSNPHYNGTEVVAQSGQSIVQVYVNYRVGVYGFLASEKIRQNGDLNVGLLDQRKALEWVRRHVSSFGGDPNHIVIHGASAGAGSIALHLAAYGGRDDHLFHGVMIQSTFWPTMMHVEDVEFKFEAFAANVTCSNTEDILACLRSKDTATLQASDQAIPFPGQTAPPLWQFLPVIDGHLIRGQLYDSFSEGKIIRVPAIIGNDENEGTYFAPNATTSEQFLMFIQNNYPALSAENLQAINSTYPIQPPLPLHEAWFPSAAAAYGESTFNCPGNEMVATMAHYVGSDYVFNYHTNIVDEMNIALGLGVPHTFETTPIFGPDQAGSCDNCSYETYNAPIVPVIMDYWISFVKTLNPNPFKSQNSPAWEPWGRDDGGQGQRIRFQTNDTGMEIAPEDEIQRCQFWRGLAATMQQ